MRKFLFVLASTVTLAIIPAVAQYVPPPYAVTPGYTAPGNTNPGYAPGYTAPGYMWREQRLNQEQRTNPVQDGQLRENNEKQRTLNNTIGSGSIGITDPNAVGGECAKGFSEETCRRRGQKYNPPRQN
jgi:hypothetical protein